jgi:hypothetical protein
MQLDPVSRRLIVSQVECRVESGYYPQTARQRPPNIFNFMINKEAVMDVGTYCDTLEKQLTGWKAKLYDVIRIVDKLSEKDKETVLPSKRGLHMIVEEIDGEVEQLRTACPEDWSLNRQNIDAKMAELQQNLKRLSAEIDGPLIPDSLSWVSD